MTSQQMGLLMKNYGIELILDLDNCDTGRFNRKELKKYFKKLCLVIDMVPCKLVFWDDAGVCEKDVQSLPHTKGTSAVQFILTSNITIHTLDILGKVFVNIFSCKKFDSIKAKELTRDFFAGRIVKTCLVKRI